MLRQPVAASVPAVSVPISAHRMMERALGLIWIRGVMAALLRVS